MASALVILIGLQVLLPSLAVAQSTLLNVSYDPTRRFYGAFNKAFAERWRAERSTPEELEARYARLDAEIALLKLDAGPPGGGGR